MNHYISYLRQMKEFEELFQLLIGVSNVVYNVPSKVCSPQCSLRKHVAYNVAYKSM